MLLGRLLPGGLENLHDETRLSPRWGAFHNVQWLILSTIPRRHCLRERRRETALQGDLSHVFLQCILVLVRYGHGCRTPSLPMKVMVLGS